MANAGNRGAELVIDGLPSLPFELIRLQHELGGTFPMEFPALQPENRAVDLS